MSTYLYGAKLSTIFCQRLPEETHFHFQLDPDTLNLQFL